MSQELPLLRSTAVNCLCSASSSDRFRTIEARAIGDMQQQQDLQIAVPLCDIQWPHSKGCLGLPFSACRILHSHPSSGFAQIGGGTP
ncbi:unnamed protein product, partial [Mycena citricolor]